MVPTTPSPPPTPPPTPASQPGVRVTRRRAQTRRRLLDAAFDAFAELGVGRVRVEDVCERARYTRGAFYSNFDSLDDLFFALYQERAAAITEQVTTALAREERTARRDLVARVVAALSFDRSWSLVVAEFTLYAARRPALSAQLAERRDVVQIALARVVDDAVDRGHLPASMRSADGFAAAILTIYHGVSGEMLIHGDEARARAWLADLLTALVNSPRA
ncbi:MAG: TetR/AcrR family transcriptional regulator [Acidimicrobiales bacterium]